MKKLTKSLIIVFALSSFFGCLSEDDEPTGCQLVINLNVDQQQLAADIAIIDAFLDSAGIQAVTDPSGLRYVINEPGQGSEDIGLCDVVNVEYEGRLLSSGTAFDSADDPVPFVLGALITGWQIGIPLIQPGGSITLYIPSVYAFGTRGAQGTVPIPPNANLIFDVDLASIN